MPNSRRSLAVLIATMVASALSVAIPADHVKAATIYYNGAGSAPRISIIGDSTIAALRWTNQFEPLKRFNYTYDAESCRRTVLPSCRGREGYTPDNTLSAMRRLSGQLGSVFVIMGGYDDPSYGFGSAVDAIMAEAARQGIPTVMWLTLRANVSYVGPGGISYSATFRAINATLYQKAIQYGPRLQIADWATYSANHPEWFYADGIHFRPAGANVVAEYIADQAARVLAGQIVTPPAGRSRPSAPRSLSAAVGYGVGSGRIRLTWQRPALTGGVPITDYVIQRSWNGGKTWVSLSDGVSTKTSYVATGTNGATYQFRVAARNAEGWSPVSNVVTATPQPTIPSAPRALTASPRSRQVVLSWVAPSSNGGLPITDYVIQRSWNGGATWVSLSDGVSTNRWYTATGLANGATYHFRVAARNAIGWSPVSNVVAATPGVAGVPSAPRSLSAVPGSGQVQLSWTAPSTNNGLPITDYVVQRSWNGGTTWVSLSDGVSTNTSYTATGLTNGATYHFRVAARNSAGWGPVSNVAAATPQAASATLLATAAVVAPDDEPTTTTLAQVTTTTSSAPATGSEAPAPSAQAAQPIASTIGDFVWLDVNDNGLQDLGEQGIEGVEVALLDTSGIELARTVTDREGDYEFTGVVDGPYVLEITLPDGHRIASAHEGLDDELDSDLTTVDELRRTARTDPFVVPIAHPDGLDMGLVPAPSDAAGEPTTSTQAPTTTEVGPSVPEVPSTEASTTTSDATTTTPTPPSTSTVPPTTTTTEPATTAVEAP